MKVILHLLSLTLLLLSCRSPKDIDTYLSQLHADGKYNGTILVIQHDSVLYERAFGYADGARTVRLTGEHQFAIGSIYKEFPAVAIMQLQEQGLLSLDDKLSAYMPQLPGWADKITVRHLFQYASGLPKIDWNAYFEKGIKVNEDQIVESLANLERLESEPGTDYIYSNYNPFLLMHIVERLSGMSFKAYVEQHIIQRHGLEGLVVKEAYPFEGAPLIAQPFDEDYKVDDYEAEVTTVCSSAQGMYQWFSQLDHFKVVSRESMQQLSQEIFPGEDSQSPLGQCDWEKGEMVQHFHHGNSQNYECLVRHYKQEGLMIILMTNQEHENLYDIADDIYAIAQRKQAKL
jgi:CubicO group peptidase (beta-lactamase class C family)